MVCVLFCMKGCRNNLEMLITAVTNFRPALLNSFNSRPTWVINFFLIEVHYGC